MKISIVTATYNRGYIIKDTLESVLKQKCKNYEYIIIDGKSKDNTVDILREYEPLFEGRMQWISEPDKGLYDAINKGIMMSTGDVVGIINSDDYFHRDDTFEVIAHAFEDTSVEAIYADDLELDVEHPENGTWRYSDSYFRRWMYRIGLMPSHPTFYGKKSLFEKYGFYKTDYKIAADFELMLRMFYVNRVSCKYIPEDIMTFRTGGVSTSWKNKMLLNKETVRACRENGLFCCMPMIMIKYIFKIKQIFKSVIRS